MNLYVKINKAYAYIIQHIRAFLRSLLFTFIIIFLLNLLPSNLSHLRQWLEQNIIYLLALGLAILIISWNKLHPTIRTILDMQRYDPSDSPIIRLSRTYKIIIFLETSALLFFVAANPDWQIWSQFAQHSARYGYIAGFLTITAFLIIISDYTFPKLPTINKSTFAPDYADDNNLPTETQQQAIGYLSDIFVNGVPRSISLSGDWGSGKTLVYKHARSATIDQRSDIIWVDFNPWQYASEEALVKGFYETIAKTIDLRIPGVQNTLIKITKSVEQLVSKTDNGNLFQTLGSILKDITPLSTSPDDIIKGLLNREGMRLIIVLDDIERQYDPERTFRSLQLVHHAKTMGDDNIQILCIFERETLLRAAPLHVQSSQEYLEKFSEIEISLPPPTQTSLRNQLETLISDPRFQSLLPPNFKLELSNESIKDIKSHRGIIRAFNEILLEFLSASKRKRKLTTSERSGSRENITYVDYTDRFLMGHIKLKYPFVYRDIAENRRLYTTTKEGEDDFREHLMDEKDQNTKRKKHFEDLFDKAGLSDDEKDTLEDLLVNLFPKTSEIFQDYKKWSPEKELRENRKIGHRDVLDAYFALTGSQDAYIEHSNWIRDLLRNIFKVSDAELVDRFMIYMQKAYADQSDIDSLTLLRNELLNRKHKSYQLRLFRAWLRAALKYPQFDSDDDDKNRVLGRILSAINDVVLGEQEKSIRIEMSSYVFHRVTTYLQDPKDALLLLLFLIPERQNFFLSDYINSKALIRQGLFDKVLIWVDKFFDKNITNIYDTYKFEDYQFIAYQWALSISTNGLLNIKVRGALDRLKHVNEYLVARLNENDQTAFDFIQARFWQADQSDDLDDESSASWRINHETMVPYSTNALIQLAGKLARSGSLTSKQRRHASSFHNELLEYSRTIDGDFVSYIPSKP